MLFPNRVNFIDRFYYKSISRYDSSLSYPYKIFSWYRTFRCERSVQFIRLSSYISLVISSTFVTFSIKDQ